MGEISSSSFEFYEGLRALVPGGFIVGLYAAICKTFGVGGAGALDTTLVAVLATLAVGFVLLFLDLPSRAAVFHYNTPVDHLKTWVDLTPRADASHKNIYYEILDVEVPSGIKTKVYYFGAIFKIGFEIIYVASISIAVLAVAILFPSVGTTRGGSQAEVRAVLIAACALHVFSTAVAIRGRRGKIRADLRAETTLLDRVTLIVATAALAVNLVGGWPWVGVVAVALPALLWAYRYHRGVHLRNQAIRRNLHASTAATTYGLAAFSVCAIGARWAEHTSPLDVRVAVGWAAASLIGAALIAARDHEKKLLGVYATQRTWLDGKRDMLVDKGYFESASP